MCECVGCRFNWKFRQYIRYYIRKWRQSFRIEKQRKLWMKRSEHKRQIEALLVGKYAFCEWERVENAKNLFINIIIFCLCQRGGCHRQPVETKQSRVHSPPMNLALALCEKTMSEETNEIVSTSAWCSCCFFLFLLHGCCCRAALVCFVRFYNWKTYITARIGWTIAKREECSSGTRSRFSFPIIHQPSGSTSNPLFQYIFRSRIVVCRVSTFRLTLSLCRSLEVW